MDQFAAEKTLRGTKKVDSIYQALQYYLRQGRIITIRRGFFATVPPNQSSDTLHVDPYLICSRICKDSVLAYHTALELHTVAHSIFQRYTFKTRSKVRSFQYAENMFYPVNHKNFDNRFSTVINLHGINIQLTNLGATYVDALDRPDLCGGWEEVYRSLSNIALLPIKEVLDYCFTLNRPVLCAKVGYFLERRTGAFSVDPSVLEHLSAKCPKSPYYLLGSAKEPCYYLKKWNLLVPKIHLSSTWEEPYHDI
ncbi:MAG: hypothetical protein ACKOAD_07045 [Gammaproteobacteria bacterium]